MSKTEVININSQNQSNLIFDANKIELSASNGLLKLIDLINQNFAQDYSSDTGFTYDSLLAQFLGGQVEQIDKTPTDSIIYISFSVDENINWSKNGGSLTGTLAGTPLPVIDSGFLKFSNVTGQEVNYSAINNANLGNIGTVWIEIQPQYSGSPATSQVFWGISKTGIAESSLAIVHRNTGDIRLSIFDENGVSASIDLGIWSPTAGNDYTLALNYDFIAGATRLFIDGTQFGSTVLTTLTMDSTEQDRLFYGGGFTAVQTPNYWVKRFATFSTVQNTSNYTQDWSAFFDTIYRGSLVIEPVNTYLGVGNIQSWDSSSISFSGLPRLIYNDLYWNGSAWVASNDTYAQANDPATIATNISTLPASDTLIRKIVFDNTNTQMSVSNNQTDYTGQIYPTDNPTIEDANEIDLVELISLAESVTKSGSDDVRSIIWKDDKWYYVSGGAIVESDESYAQTSLLSDFASLLSTFITIDAEFKIKRYLHSDDGSTTPTISSNTIVYEPTAIISTQEIYDYLEGYGIDTDVISSKWVAKRITNIIVPWINTHTRLNFNSEEEITEYLSGTGLETLQLSRAPINELVSLTYVNTIEVVGNIVNTVVLDNEHGILIAKTNPNEGVFNRVFRKGNKNIKVVYKVGYNNFIDNDGNEIVDIKEAIVYMACKQVLIQIGARTGGGALSQQAWSRNYGPRGKYNDIINDLDMMAHAIIRKYMTGVVGA